MTTTTTYVNEGVDCWLLRLSFGWLTGQCISHNSAVIVVVAIAVDVAVAVAVVAVVAAVVAVVGLVAAAVAVAVVRLGGRFVSRWSIGPSISQSIDWSHGRQICCSISLSILPQADWLAVESLSGADDSSS